MAIFFESLLLQEVSFSGPLLLGHGGQHTDGRVEVPDQLLGLPVTKGQAWDWLYSQQSFSLEKLFLVFWNINVCKITKDKYKG